VQLNTPADMPPDIAFFLALERRVWQALVDGDADADRRLLDPEFVGVYASGFASREDHSAQLTNGASVGSFSINQPRLLVLAPDVALISYQANFTRPGQSGDEAIQAVYISSIWKRRGECWFNVFSQDTAANGVAR
jgi:hypothetical protein